jgi:carbonic anhydrase/acetyltransferase-like protein (isoleucine patch superfamily)
MSLTEFKNARPKLDKEAYVAEGARIIGDVAIGKGSSIWFNTVVRGDVNYIRIGEYSNIQDNSTVHVGSDFYPTIIGDNVTVGHNVLLHGCKIGKECLIGMGAIILNGAEIGENCIIGAGSLITEGKKIPANSLVFGSPGRVVRTLSQEDIEKIRHSAVHYHKLSLNYYTPK